MDITWLGHAATRLRTRQTSVVMDPTDRSAGVDMNRPAGEIVTISRDHPQHNHREGVRGNPFEVGGPGEYEIRGMQLEGLPALWPAAEGEATETTTLYIGLAEEMRFVHLGGLGQRPTAAQSQRLSQADILIIPIALPGGLTPEAAAGVTVALEPKIVIPVGFSPGERGHSPELLRFLEEMGADPEEPLSRLSIQSRNVGESRRVVLLDSRAKR